LDGHRVIAIPATLARQIIEFALAGSVGFAVNASALHALIAGGLGPIPAEMISFLVASLFTWQINRHRAFASCRDRSRPWPAEWARYVAAGAGGYVVTNTVFAAGIWYGFSPLVSLVIGATAAAAFNFLSCLQWVFKKLP
jgi:putative flippase GtrA